MKTNTLNKILLRALKGDKESREIIMDEVSGGYRSDLPARIDQTIEILKNITGNKKNEHQIEVLYLFASTFEKTIQKIAESWSPGDFETYLKEHYKLEQ